MRKFESWDFVALVLDESGVCVGLVAQDLKNMKLKAFPADAVCLGTGGPGLIFGRSTNSLICTGGAAGEAYRQGAIYANGEFIQVHPTAIPGADKLRLISESARGEGGRIWVPKDAKDKREPKSIPDKDRDYFLERLFPGYGNLVPRDIASRTIFQVCFHEESAGFSTRRPARMRTRSISISRTRARSSCGTSWRASSRSTRSSRGSTLTTTP